MEIEHVAFNVADSRAAAKWYVENLGMRVVHQGGPPAYGHFLADSSGARLLEIYSNPAVAVPSYADMDSRCVHVAFSVDNVSRVRDMLIAAGAKADGQVENLSSGGEIAVVRDPWGLAVQLVRRATPLVGP